MVTIAENVSIDSISVEIEQTAGLATSNLDALTKSLKKLGKGVESLRLESAVKQFESLGQGTQAIADLASAAEKLGAVNISVRVSNQLQRIGETVRGLADIDPSVIERIADSIERIGNSTGNIDSKEFTSLTKRVSTLERNVKSAEKTSNSFWDSFLNGSQKAESALSKLVKKVFSFQTAIKLYNSVFSLFTLSSQAYETLNLANISMATKELAESAQEYAEAVQESYGIDSMEFLKYQSTIMDISRSFGIATNTAYKMSKALTQLTYDYSSFYNISVSDAATKMQQVITGELEGIRRLGKDISVANLQVQAANLGITTAIDSMTQAEKAMLRTISVLKQSTSAMGDMARTLDSSSNQMRILNAQWTLFKRSLGDLVLPLTQKALPYLIALAKVAREIVVEFASLRGVELPAFDWSDESDAIDSITDSVSDANDEIEKLYQLSFDELNILGTSSSTDTASSLEDMAKLEAELDRLTEEYDKTFSEMIGKTSDEITEKLRNWITQGQSIEEWVGKINDKLVKLKDNIDLILALGVGTKLAIDTFKIAKYFGKLDDLVGILPKVTGGFKSKTKALSEQTEATATETSTVAQLIAKYASLPATLASVALGIGVLTAVFKSLNATSVETANGVTENLNGMAESTAESLSSVEMSAVDLTENLLGLGVTSMELSEFAGKSIFNTVESYSSQIVTAADTYGEEFYNSMSSVAHDIDTEYATVFDNIYSNYVNLMENMGVTTASSGYTATTAAKLSDSERARVKARGEYLRKAVDPYDEYNYAVTGTTSSSTDDHSSVLQDYLKAERAKKSISNFIQYTGETLGNILKKIIGIAGFAGMGVPAFASGGMVEDGLFYANSNELVGRFSNGKTAVANNEQITEGIANAVYRAVSSAMRQNRGSGRVELVLDRQVVGKVFGDAIETEKRRSGANTRISFSSGGK